jgi:hypothetical protein
MEKGVFVLSENKEENKTGREKITKKAVEVFIAFSQPA